MNSGIRVMPDETNNSLVILCSPQQYKVIEKTLKELDIEPLQVLIEASIIEVTLTGSLQYGVTWAMNNNGIGNAVGKGTVTPTGLVGTLPLSQTHALEGVQTLASIAGTGGSFNILSTMAHGTLNSILNTAASDGLVNVLSSPSLMVVNNKPATINVGTQLSILGPTTTIPSAGGVSTVQSPQYLSTGVTLNVTPRINNSGQIAMDIAQTVSNPGATGTGNNPNINTRQVNSSVVIQSGETVVLGGIIQASSSESDGGMPGLHKIPLFGALFNAHSEGKNRTELLVMITPKIVRNRHDAVGVSADLKSRMRHILPIARPPAGTVPSNTAMLPPEAEETSTPAPVAPPPTNGGPVPLPAIAPKPKPAAKAKDAAKSGATTAAAGAALPPAGHSAFVPFGGAATPPPPTKKPPAAKPPAQAPATPPAAP
jgi:general secretion pathway protein D